MALTEARSTTDISGCTQVVVPRTTVIGAYFALTKPRVMSLLLFTTLAALLIAVRQHPLPDLRFWEVMFGTLAGGAFASGGAAALNCYIDRDIDLIMARTRNRAIPAGILRPYQVLAFGLTLSALSVIVLLATTNVVA